MITILIVPTDPRWHADMERAREIDRMAVEEFGQRDPCHHLCSEQRSQQARGYMMVEVSTNMFGYCVRDTINDGLGVLFGGRARPGTTKAEALEWARQWHAERPTHREVIMGYESASALEKYGQEAA